MKTESSAQSGVLLINLMWTTIQGTEEVKQYNGIRQTCRDRVRTISFFSAESGVQWHETKYGADVHELKSIWWKLWKGKARAVNGEGKKRPSFEDDMRCEVVH